MGRADFAPKRFYDKVSLDDTYPNAITSYNTSAYKIPLIVKNDKEVFEACIASSIKIDYDNPHIIVINNSLEIEEMLISTSLIEEATKTGHISIESEPFDLEFDAEGNLITKF